MYKTLKPKIKAVLVGVVPVVGTGPILYGKAGGHGHKCVRRLATRQAQKAKAFKDW
jgi:hypothetical protein